jgi:hypothetical protein
MLLQLCRLPGRQIFHERRRVFVPILRFTGQLSEQRPLDWWRQERAAQLRGREWLLAVAGINIDGAAGQHLVGDQREAMPV